MKSIMNIQNNNYINKVIDSLKNCEKNMKSNSYPSEEELNTILCELLAICENPSVEMNDKMDYSGVEIAAAIWMNKYDLLDRLLNLERLCTIMNEKCHVDDMEEDIVFTIKALSLFADSCGAIYTLNDEKDILVDAFETDIMARMAGVKLGTRFSIKKYELINPEECHYEKLTYIRTTENDDTYVISDKPISEMYFNENGRIIDFHSSELPHRDI